MVGERVARCAGRVARLPLPGEAAARALGLAPLTEVRPPPPRTPSRVPPLTSHPYFPRRGPHLPLEKGGEIRPARPMGVGDMRVNQRNEREETPVATAVQVVSVWNSWVQVRFPDTGETTWVNLEETPYAETSAPQR